MLMFKMVLKLDAEVESVTKLGAFENFLTAQQILELPVFLAIRFAI